MPSAYVTGATGFVGLNLVKQLTEEGWHVRALHRRSSDLTYLSRFDVERVMGDVTDRKSLERTMQEDVDVVFHVAASVSFWSPNNAVTKYLADEEVRAGIEKGLHAVFVHPGYVLGPYELSNFSQIFRMLKQGKLPGTFSGAGPWCHVDTVVDALIRAAEVGRPGERYLIGAAHASVHEVVGKMAERLGVKPPKALPAWVMKSMAHVMDWGSRLTRKEPDLTPEVAHMFSMDITFDCSKAERELGYEETSIDQMVDDMHAWLQAEGRI